VEQLRRKVEMMIQGKVITVLPVEPDIIQIFTDLADVPASYASSGNFVARVKSTEDVLEFAELKGTTNQITVTANAADFTLSLPQDIHAAATPTFAGLTLNVAAGDPMLNFAIGGVTKFTMGVDDSDGDAWKLSAGGVLGTTDRIVVTADPRIGFFTASPQAPIHYITPSPGNIPDIIFEETMADKALQLRLKNPVRSWDIVSDSLPDRFALYDATLDNHPFFIEGGTNHNIGLFHSINLVQWESETSAGRFGTGARHVICIDTGSPSVFPATLPSSSLEIGAFALGLGIKESVGNIVSYYGGPRILINETENWDMTRGITINCGNYQDQVLAFKSGLVAHGMTTLAETDTFADFRINQAEGGLEINAYTEGTTVALGLYGWYPTGNTDLDSTGWAEVTIYAGKKAGTTYGDCGATDNIFALRPRYGSAWTTCWIANATGNTWQGGMLTAPQGTFNIADGTAPLVVTSTTEVANLNAHLLQGNHASAFEPSLGNPGTDGFVLSSTIAGVRSWIAPGGGGGADHFVDLLDVPAAYAGAGGYVVKVKADASGLEFVAGGAGVSSFNDLDDVPASYVGQEGLFLKVNATADGLEYGAGSAGAPDTAQYVCLAVDAGLSAERVLTAGTGLTLTDAGANGAATLAIDSPKVVSRHCWIHETFDALATGSIIGLGSYFEAGAWAWGTQGAGSTAAVTVKSGADKMLTITAAAQTGASNITSTLTTAIGFMGGSRWHWKMKLNVDGAGVYGAVYTTDKRFEIYFRYSTTFQISFYNGTTATKLKNAAKDTWYEIDAFMTSGHTTPYVSIFIDGVYMGRYQGVAPTAGDAWSTLYVEAVSPVGAAATVFDVDDLYVYSLYPLGLD
jgi:hypothetical protein